MKPTSRRRFPLVKQVRPLRDDEVDRSSVEVRQRMELDDTNRSRAYSESIAEVKLVSRST